MKKVICFFLFASFLFAGTQCMAQKKKDYKFELNASMGVLSTFFKDKPEKLYPPVSFGIKYRFNKLISLDAYVGYSCSEECRLCLNNEMMEWENKFSVIGLRGAIHSTKLRKWDFYGGMMLNYNISRIKILKGNSTLMQEHMGIRPRSSNVSVSGFVGAMFLLAPELGIFSELGFGVCLLNLGVGYRF